MRDRLLVSIAALLALCSQAQSSDSGPYVERPPELIADGVPSIPQTLADQSRPYLEYRTAIFRGWNAANHSMIVSTRFGNTSQIHEVKAPNAARTQLSFESDPIALASWAPKTADVLLLQKDIGGDEFFQLYTLTDGRLRLLTETANLSRIARPAATVPIAICTSWIRASRAPTR
jgi:hypothetical protein